MLLLITNYLFLKSKAQLQLEIYFLNESNTFQYNCNITK